MKKNWFFTNTVFIFFILFISLHFQACRITVSTSGTSVPVTAKTFSVLYFPNRAPQINPKLSQYFTEELKDKLLDDTRLDLVKQNGHLNFEGEITGYETRPMAIQSNDRPAQNRLTITVRVRFTCAKDEKLNFDQSFSRFADYSSALDLKQVENQLVESIVTELVDDIFLKAAADW